MKSIMKIIHASVIALGFIQQGLSTDLSNNDDLFSLFKQLRHVKIEILKHIGSDDIKSILFVSKDFNQFMQEKELWYIYCRNAKFIPLSAAFDFKQDYDNQYKFFSKISITFFDLQQEFGYSVSAISADARTLVGEFLTEPPTSSQQWNIDHNGYPQVRIVKCPYVQNVQRFAPLNFKTYFIQKAFFESVQDIQSYIGGTTYFQFEKLSEDGSVMTGQLNDFDNRSLNKPCIITRSKTSRKFDLTFLGLNGSYLSEEKIELSRELDFKKLRFHPKFHSACNNVFAGYVVPKELNIFKILIKNCEDFLLSAYLFESGVMSIDFKLTSIDAMTSNGVAIVGKAYDWIRKQNLMFRATIPTSRNKF